jgi:hypothetical protein
MASEGLYEDIDEVEGVLFFLTFLARVVGLKVDTESESL